MKLIRYKIYEKILNDRDKIEEQLGPSLALTTEVIQEIINPLKVYCAQFGEEGTELHFHVFPRTSKITSEFLNAFPEQKDSIHGPLLLDWTRSEYKYSEEKVWSIASPVVIKMRKRIKRLQVDRSHLRRTLGLLE